jgi:hypothetical protein
LIVPVEDDLNKVLNVREPTTLFNAESFADLVPARGLKLETKEFNEE